jgi:hypothetical protein
MVFVPVPNAARAVVVFDGADGEFTFGHWFTLEGFNIANQIALATIVFDAVSDYLIPHISNRHRLRQVKVYDMREEEGPIASPPLDPVQGASGEQALPLSLSVVVTLYTGLRGRAWRGRMYIPGSTEFHMTNGRFTDMLIQAVNNMVAAIHANAQTENWTPVVAHRYVGKQPLQEGQTAPVTSFAIRSPLPGSQRRRTRRG